MDNFKETYPFDVVHHQNELMSRPSINRHGDDLNIETASNPPSSYSDTFINDHSQTLANGSTGGSNTVDARTHEFASGGPTLMACPKAYTDNNGNICRHDTTVNNIQTATGDLNTPVYYPHNMNEYKLMSDGDKITGKGDRIVIKIDKCLSILKSIDDTLLDDDCKLQRRKTSHCKSGLPLASSSSTCNLGFPSDMNSDGGLLKPTSGSLSDNSYQRPATRQRDLERSQMEERLRNWKRSNKIITNIKENPFSMHLDCLERLSSLEYNNLNSICSVGSNKRLVDDEKNDEVKFTLNSEPENQVYDSDQIVGEIAENGQNVSMNVNQEDKDQHQHHEHLQNYASHLSQVYKNNQALMDSNRDFRALLYNIICCLLIQDDQVLATPSVTKMIDVIRTHLDSVARSYSVAMQSVNLPDSRRQSRCNLNERPVQLSVTQNLDGNMNCKTYESFNLSSASEFSGDPQTNRSGNDITNSNGYSQTSSGLRPDRSQKPADFRRISSVSYNDEQLIHDLCDMGPNHNNNSTTSANGSGNGYGGSRCPESPWKFEELLSECKHHNDNSALHTSQSSLENNSANIETMNDSGVGTIADSHATDDLMSRAYKYPHRKRHSDISDFRPKQQPSYMSTDDFLSQEYYDSENITSIYDDETSTGRLHKRNSMDTKNVDVASRRAELEWTLNKLINFELKYTWLTSKDTLRRAIRKIGIPNEVRGKVWLILIDQLIGDRYDAKQILKEAANTIDLEERGELKDEETSSIMKQIVLDVNRTMPGHKLFDDGAEGGVKLRRILVAYSIHVNRAIAYCQGFNFIVALLLSVLDGDEEKALRGFVCVVDHIFPSKFYFDHYLTGARADQFLLADFICDQLIKNPTAAERKMIEGVTSSITLNWFISLFHGAVPTLVTPPSSCEVFATIRNTAKDMYDIKLLLSIVEQIKLPKDSYFAIRRSFYMLQSSFNSDQFYMQSLSNDSGRQLVSNKPLSVQQLPGTKPPSMSFITAASLVAHQSFGIGDNTSYNSTNGSRGGPFGPRVCVSSDRSKVCVQNIGKLGRSHLKIIDANVRSNERSLMSPLRNCLVIGISNCGKNLVVARQSSRRNYKIFREQDLVFHIHEICTEIFDGFYLENRRLALILTHQGEIYKIDTSKCFADGQAGSTETLLLRDSQSIGAIDKIKLRIASMDVLTNFLWIYVECDDTVNSFCPPNSRDRKPSVAGDLSMLNLKPKFKDNNPFTSEANVSSSRKNEGHPNYQRKILIVDVITFDIFSAFSVQQNFGDILNMRTSLLAFCQLSNPASNNFSSKIMQIGPTGRYEQLLSFSDVVDYMIDVPESYKKPTKVLESTTTPTRSYSTIKKFLTSSISMNHDDEDISESRAQDQEVAGNFGTLTRYYKSLMKSHLTTESSLQELKQSNHTNNQRGLDPGTGCQRSTNENPSTKNNSKRLLVHPFKAVMTSYLGEVEEFTNTNYVPVNMAFIFRNGKIALFEFTESYAIHTRESQLDRYDYSKVIDVKKSGNDFIITILTIYDKLIKVVI